MTSAGASRQASMLRSLVLFGPAAVWTAVAVLGVWLTLNRGNGFAPLDRRSSTVEGSEACGSCHPKQWETWHQSYHRTMTQRADEADVLAPFAGEHFEYLGFRADMTRVEGRPHVRVVAQGDDGGQNGQTLLDVDVELTIGSHRYQQYAARGSDAAQGELWRLPVAWHIGEKRWIHLNGAFVEPEGVSGDRDDYFRHLNRWNDNCLFCHNTEPVPGKQRDGSFASELGEVGVACEACHGPASRHIERHVNPFRRLLSRVVGQPDGSIAHLGRLDPGLESAACGRCHGQRIAKDIATVMIRGDGFLPGAPLSEVSRPIFADSRMEADPQLSFAERFWPDQTPRLSAYEYQGLLLSPCYDGGREGGLGCNHCHDMHGSRPDKQLRGGRERDAACADCHPSERLSGAERTRGHGNHPAPVGCIDCHMPSITYGLLEGMVSHRITVPNPGALLGRHDQPDACTQCHVGSSRAWAADGMHALGFDTKDPVGTPDPSEHWASRVVLDLYGGDPIQRNLAAHTLGRPDTSGASSHERMAWLVDALEDEYASVRWFAWRAMRALARLADERAILENVERYDYLGEAEHRISVAQAVRALVGPGPFADHPERQEQLLGRRDDRAIWIGE